MMTRLFNYFSLLVCSALLLLLPVFAIAGDYHFVVASDEEAKEYTPQNVLGDWVTKFKIANQK